MSGFLQVSLGNVVVRFTYEDRQAELQLGLLFQNWPPSPEWPAPADDVSEINQPLDFMVQVVETLGSLPSNSHLIFCEQNSLLPDQSGLTRVYDNEPGFIICFGNDAVVQIPATVGDEDPPLQARVARGALHSGRLEDIIFCSLAPLLRRRGFFLIHAFAAVKDERSLLLVGESGSGKTTTGLSLIAHGWQYLANDVVLLREREGLVQVWPTPGGISLDRESFALLPHLPQLADIDPEHMGKHSFPAAALIEGWAAPATATHILFPKVTENASTGLQRQSRSVTLARLMEGSVDRWDVLCLNSHLRFLELLSRQTQAYDLHLGKDLGQLSDVLNQVW
jgi:hypothetical protein